ncbi:hypothetical protein QP185_02450 [Sphingomonas aerolata]|uniref:hypothetical protein n=1 Tax=Sphingomonas aerolata TaxID=185951 RepID=UPI002FE1A9CE
MTIEVAEQPKVTVVETMPDRLALPVWTLIAPGLGLVAVLFGLAKMGSIGTAAAIVVLIASVLAAVPPCRGHRAQGRRAVRHARARDRRGR